MSDEPKLNLPAPEPVGVPVEVPDGDQTEGDLPAVHNLAVAEPELPAVQKPPGVLRETFQTLDRFWFGFGSPTTMGLFRIAICSLTVISLLMLLPEWDDWFTERGYLPSWIAERYLGSQVPVRFGSHWTVPRIDLLQSVTDPRVSLAFILGTILFGLLTTVGLWTRLTSIVFAIGVVSIQHRTAAILYGGDSITRVGCLYVALAPSGKACSIDRLVGLWKGRITAAPVLVSMWPQRLVAFNVALLYLTTTWLKWEGAMWQDGTATYYPARLAEFQRFPVPSFFNEFPFVYFTTYGTLAVEFAMATLVFFRPCRKWVLLGGVALHMDIEYSMNIPLFSYLVLATYLAFYDGEEVSGWAVRLGERLRRFKVDVFLPVGMRLRPQAAGFLDAVDPLKLVRYVPEGGPTWTATRADGSAIPVAKAIGARSIGAWIFGWVPGLWDRILRGAVEPCPAPPEAEPPAAEPNVELKGNI